MKVCLVLGTRPEIIKLVPIVKEIQRRKLDYYIIHSGQHYSYNLDRVFFEQLHMPKPRYKLEVGSGKPGEQTAKIIVGVEKIISKNKPSAVLVQGDTNTVLGGALAARKTGVILGHVEAGLRSYDERMPEEYNRKIADHCSDYLFAPTKISQKILKSEGISKEKIFVTGNTIVDSVYQNLKYSEKSPKLKNLGVKSREYFLVSLHRQENVDNLKNLGSIIKGLKRVKKQYGLPVIFPIHPRTKKMAKKFGMSFDGITILDPIDYFAFLLLEKNALLVMTDSGGVQEEACILKTPCVTLRNNTERPETLQVGANIIAGTNPDNIAKKVKVMINRKKGWKNPFGDGNAARKILKILKEKIE